jgi:hypothetical protein
VCKRDFSSTEDSFRDIDAEDQTINITGLLASRASAGSDVDSMTGSSSPPIARASPQPVSHANVFHCSRVICLLVCS